MKKILLALAFALIVLPVSAQFNKAGFRPSLEPEFVCDFADWTPEDSEVTGSTQGFAMHGKYAFVLHDKGRICIFDMKKKKLVNTFLLEGNRSHCNNACFGVEKASRDSKFPLLYIASCGGENCLFLGDALKTRMKEFMDEKLESYALVKTPHHGDYYKAFKEFTEETAFDYAVICAEENGDTIEEKLLQALNDAGAQTFFTYNGDISASFSPLALSQTP